MRLSHFSTDNGKCPKMVQNIQALILAPHHGRLAFLRFRFMFPLSQPKMRLEQCSLRQRVLLAKNLQSTQCQTFELDTTPRLVGQLRCVQAKVAP